MRVKCQRRDPDCIWDGGDLGGFRKMSSPKWEPPSERAAVILERSPSAPEPDGLGGERDQRRLSQHFPSQIRRNPLIAPPRELPYAPIRGIGEGRTQETPKGTAMTR